MSFYWPWLAGLPIFWSCRGVLVTACPGPIGVRLAVGLSRALVLFCLLCAIFTLALAHDGISRFRFFAFSLALVNWAVLPASALLIGALPFVKKRPMIKA
jgi:hypothetical protein